MPRVHGVRERRHQPFWDTLIRTTGAPTPALLPTQKLFGNANIGQSALTNLQTAGVLAADQTYVVLALRAYLYFQGTNSEELYQQVSSQLYFTFQLGDKPSFQCPCWYLPAGGGVFGAPAQSNGWPSQDSIMKLGRPIVIPVRQNISVDATFHAMGVTNAVTLINGAAEDDQMEIKFIFDGLQTRDVQ